MWNADSAVPLKPTPDVGSTVFYITSMQSP
jgi:hypothetical protein